jgi:large subunit ribosomal protein L23
MNAYILKNPVITEKTLFLANRENAYTFEVPTTVTKTQIKEAVEEVFSVKVTSVNTVMHASSKKRTGRRRMSTSVPRTKKAVVTLVKGNTIALFDLSGAQETAPATK